MTRRRVDYEVAEGDIINPFHKQPTYPVPTFPNYHNHFSQKATAYITLPVGTLPEPKERWKMISAAKAQGLNIGTRVIRVRHITEFMITQEHLIGTLLEFTLHMVPGYTCYRPIIVRFMLGDSNYSDMPFNADELETLENAKKQVVTRKAELEALDKRLREERSGVIPFHKHMGYN